MLLREFLYTFCPTDYLTTLQAWRECLFQVDVCARSTPGVKEFHIVSFLMMCNLIMMVEITAFLL